MEIKYRELLDRMKKRGVTQREAAERIRIDPAGMSRKLRGTQPFFLDEAVRLAELLKIQTLEEFCRLFFPARR